MPPSWLLNLQDELTPFLLRTELLQGGDGVGIAHECPVGPPADRLDNTGGDCRQVGAFLRLRKARPTWRFPERPYSENRFNGFPKLRTRVRFPSPAHPSPALSHVLVR